MTTDATQEKEKQANGSPEEATATTFNEEFQKELAVQFAKDKKTEVPEKPADGGTAPVEKPVEAPAAAPAADGQGEPAQHPSGVTPEDEPLLKEYGIDPKEATPSVVKALKAANTRAGEAESKAHHWGSQNKQLSEQYQNLKKEHRALIEKAGEDPKELLDIADKLFSDEELAKLPQEAQDILKDRNARLAFVMTVQKMTKMATAGKAAASPDHDGTAAPAATRPLEESREAGFTEEQAKKVHEWADAKIKEAGYANYAETYASNDFRKFVEPIVAREVEQAVEFYHTTGIPLPNDRSVLSPTFMKLNSANPNLHVEVLRGFDEYKKHMAESAKDEATRQQHAAALDGHGATKPAPKTAGKTLGEMTESEITGLPTAEFKRLSTDKSARSTYYS